MVSLMVAAWASKACCAASVACMDAARTKTTIAVTGDTVTVTVQLTSTATDEATATVEFDWSRSGAVVIVS